MGLFRKKSVPAELPDLAIDQARKTNQAAEVKTQTSSTKFRPLPKQLPKTPTPKTTPQSNQTPEHSQDEKGYFKELVKSVTEETNNIEKLDSWYKNKFLPGDMVFQMREYWQKQQPEILLHNVRGDLKNKLMDKTARLHTLEKEWQDIYFTLLSKEEEIRKEEKDLKDSLSEFVSIFKQAQEKSKKK